MNKIEQLIYEAEMERLSSIKHAEHVTQEILREYARREARRLCSTHLIKYLSQRVEVKS